MLLLSMPLWAAEFAAGRVTLNAPVGGGSTPIFTTVNFRQTYSAAPLVFVVNSNQAASESNIRIRNVSTTGFEVAHVFPDNSVSNHPDLDIDYIAIEAGVHSLAGNTLVAGFIDTVLFQSTPLAGDSWDDVDFVADHSVTFSAAPSVIAQIQTMANETTPDLSTPSSPFMDVAIRNITVTDMDIAIERAETTTGTPPALVNERIAYLAMASGDTGTFNDSGGASIRYQAIQSADNVTGNCTNVGITGFTATPIAIASNNKRDGADGSWTRVCSKSSTNISVKVQEDIAGDGEVGHTSEAIGVFAVSEAFDLGGAFQAEAGSMSITGTSSGSLGFTSVTFGTAFSSVPRIFSLPVNVEAEPVALRIKSVSVNGFQIAQVQPTGETGGAESMTVDYIAAIDGVHFLNDSTPLEVGAIATALTQFTAPVTGTAGWATIDFDHDFGVGNAPVVLLQIQSIANEPFINPSNASVPWLGTTSQTVTPTSIQVALERAESAAGSVTVPETIAYLAVQPNTTGTFQMGFSNISFESQRVNGIQGVDNGCFSNNFLGSYSGVTPIAVASQYLRNGVNGGWVKRCAINSTAIGLQIDEDRSNDAERTHIAEEAHIFALSEAFIGDFPKPQLMMLKNAGGVSTANSGDTLTYTITVTNTGLNSGFNVLLNDAMPGFSGLVLDAYGPSTPFSFAPGTSALTLGTPVYSQDDGADAYAYTPAATGTDSTITDWRIPMGGVMPTSGSFTLQYQVVID